MYLRSDAVGPRIDVDGAPILGCVETVAGGLYRAGLALLDLEDPSRVLRRSDEWVLGPNADYEVSGDVPNVVFHCGLVHHPDTDRLFLYYGAADTRIALATAPRSTVLGYLLDCPPGWILAPSRPTSDLTWLRGLRASSSSRS